MIDYDDPLAKAWRGSSGATVGKHSP